MKPTQRPSTEEKWSPRVWHRRASKPVSVWMMVFLVCGAAHPLIPNYRWVLIHLFTLGILSNSILVWSQHLSEKFVQQRLPDSARPWQLRRIHLFNLGVIAVLTGQVLIGLAAWHWIVTACGATVVAVCVAWHGSVLARQWAGAAAKRFRPVVAAYIGSAFSLSVGAIFGALLAHYPGHPKLLLAHIAANIGGFVGLAAAGSLTILFPSIWRTKGTNERMRLSFALLGAGVVATVVGAFTGWPQIGLIVYCAGWMLSLHKWVDNALTVAREPRGRVTYPAVSVLCAACWLVGALAYFTAQSFLLVQPAIPTLALVVGFAAQLLFGTMSYLLPTTMGGGPSATRAGLAELDRWGWLRAVLLNAGLVLWIAAGDSWAGVAASLLALGTFAVFPVLIARAIKAQRAVITQRRAG